MQNQVLWTAHCVLIKKLYYYTIHIFFSLPLEKIGGHSTFRTDMCREENQQQKKDNIRAIQSVYRDEGIRISFKLMGGGTTNDGMYF